MAPASLSPQGSPVARSHSPRASCCSVCGSARGSCACACACGCSVSSSRSAALSVRIDSSGERRSCITMRISRDRASEAARAVRSSRSAPSHERTRLALASASPPAVRMWKSSRSARFSRTRAQHSAQPSTTNESKSRGFGSTLSALSAPPSTSALSVPPSTTCARSGRKANATPPSASNRSSADACSGGSVVSRPSTSQPMAEGSMTANARSPALTTASVSLSGISTHRAASAYTATSAHTVMLTYSAVVAAPRNWP
mmetsp:Transcript_24080/g.62047  ORF Transcript_24080/g.62047 Transcript_24080/m.62047 type:complete len:258 (+) Transcript_24080:170-943(+)